MDDVCLSMRMFRHFNHQSPNSVEEWVQNIPEFLETAEENVILELRTIILEELQNGLPKESLRAVLRTTSDAIGTAPLARGNHFVYGILDLIQQHVQMIDTDKIYDFDSKVNHKIVELSLEVVKQSQYSYLRGKAFELLIAMSSKSEIGSMPIKSAEELLAKSDWPRDLKNKIRDQLRIMRTRAVNMEYFLLGLRETSAHTPLTTEGRQVSSI
jgi:hypothetical protein